MAGEYDPLKNDAVEYWLRTTVKAACERLDSEQERTYSVDEVHEMLKARRAELRRRIDDIENGQVQMLDADEMDAELLAELADFPTGNNG